MLEEKLPYCPEIPYSGTAPTPELAQAYADFEQATNSRLAEFFSRPQDFSTGEMNSFLNTLGVSLAGLLQKDPLLPDFILKDLQEEVRLLQDNIRWSWLFEKRRASGLKSKIAQTLSNEGVWTDQMDRTRLAKLGQVLKEKYYEALKQKFHPSARLNVVTLPPASAEYQESARLMKELGVSQGVSEFFGYPVEIFYIALILNRDAENWYYPPELNRKPNDLHYLHLDGDPNVVKTIMYLHDVGPNGGPYRFIERRDFELKKDLRYFIRLSNDGIFNPRFGSDRSNHYYRKITLPENSAYFGNLPPLFRRLTHFGDDIPDGSDLAKRYLSREFVMTSDRANLVVFDGSSLLHRGGQVQQGERLAIQVAYRPMITWRDYKRVYVGRIKSLVKKILRYEKAP